MSLLPLLRRVLFANTWTEGGGLCLAIFVVRLFNTRGTDTLWA